LAATTIPIEPAAPAVLDDDQPQTLRKLRVNTRATISVRPRIRHNELDRARWISLRDGQHRGDAGGEQQPLDDSLFIASFPSDSPGCRLI
jgi:hypothetical protein